MVAQPCRTTRIVCGRLAWRAALDRPSFNVELVESDLCAALSARGLDWMLQRFDNARDAWAALTVFYSSRRGWIKHDALLLTVGLRDAYSHGLGIAIPIAPNVLGWALDEEARP